MFPRDVTLIDIERLDRMAAAAVETLQMDEDTFRAFYDRTARPVWVYLARITGDRAIADDLLQESYYRFLRAERSFASESHRRNYLYRIATNLCMDQLRRRKLIRWEPWEAFVSLFHPKQVARDNPERDALRQESRELVHRVLQELPPRYRICLVLREYHGMSCEEIGDVIGSSRSAVKSLLFRAREEFRQVYQRMGGTDPL